jgi:cell division protein FtsI/penicillin-binding protein 2
LPSVNFTRRADPGRNTRVASAGSAPPPAVNSVRRARILYGCLLAISAIFIIRLFYLQVIRHEYYHNAALASQLKQYEIPAERGVISAHDGNTTAALVLNETKYTVFADPTFIKDAAKEALDIQKIIGGDTSKLSDLLKTKDTRYVILAKKIDKAAAKKIDKLDFAGVGTRAETYRTYPQGAAAAQILGFVNTEGEGQYGIEQYFNAELGGTPGELKAITDASGVPLVSNPNNIVRDAVAGNDITLTIDVGMQRQVEALLKQGLDKAKSKSGSAVVMDPNSGAVIAMANYPSYDPTNMASVTDLSVLSNAAVSAPLEIGSVMKPLTTSAALDIGVINPNSTYYDPGRFVVDGSTVTNVEGEDGAGTRSIEDILQLSLNTGAVWILQQMGGGQINQKARDTWYDYMTNHFQLGKTTGIEQMGEAGGLIPNPDKGDGLNVQYANTAFGQGMTATPLQLAAALSSAINGGTYYKPHLVDKQLKADGGQIVTKPQVLKDHVVSTTTSEDIKTLMEYVVTSNHVLYGMPHLRDGYVVGGKTGTAEIASPSGGYYKDKFNGLFTGFVGGDKPQYVIVIKVDDPTVSGFAGAGAAAPIFSSITNMLIDNFGVTPKS